MDTEKQRVFIIRFIYFIVVLGIAIFACRFALPAMLPFVIALLVALLLQPAIRFFHEKCRVHKGVASVVLVMLFYALIVFLLTILSIKLITTAKDFFLTLPARYYGTIQPWLIDTFDSLQAFANRLDPQAVAAYDVVAANLTQTLGDAVSSLSKTVVGGATTLTMGLPGLLVDVIIAVIATVFIATDWSLLGRFISRQLSPKTRGLVENIRTHLGLTLGRYIRSYALIMFITFVELSIGLSIVGIKSPFGIAVVIALFDILPVVGCGTVLIPWCVISVIQGDLLRALGLIIVYLVILVIRNVIEPKIIGDHVGLHPIITLMGMVVGLYVFGPIGLLGLPITLALIKSLNDEGVIHLYDNSIPLNKKPKGDRPTGGSDPADEPLKDDAEQAMQSTRSLPDNYEKQHPSARKRKKPSGTDIGA